MKIFSLLCFTSILLTCAAKHVVPVSNRLVPSTRRISYLRGNPSIHLERRPYFYGEKGNFITGGRGFYGVPNIRTPYYQSWYNNHQPLNNNLNRGTYFGRGPYHIPSNFLNTDRHLWNEVNTIWPFNSQQRAIVSKCPFKGKENQICFSNDGIFFHSQPDVANSLIQQFPFINGGSYFNERPHNKDEMFVIDASSIIEQGDSNRGHTDGGLIIKGSDSKVENASNIYNGAHSEKEGSNIEGYILNDDGSSDSVSNYLDEGLLFDGSSLNGDSILSKEEGAQNNANFNLNELPLDNYIDQELSHQIVDAEISKKSNSSRNDGLHYIVDKPTRDKSINYDYDYRKFSRVSENAYSPLGVYRGANAYGGAGAYDETYVGGGASLGRIGIGGAGMASRASISGEIYYDRDAISRGASLNSGAVIGGGTGTDEVAGIGRGINISGGAGISGKGIRGGAGIYEGVNGGIGEGRGIGGGIKIGGGASIEGDAAYGGAGINGATGFNGGSYWMPSQLSYIYRKQL